MSIHVIGVDSNGVFKDFSIKNGTIEEVESKLKELKFEILSIKEFKS